MKYRLLSGILIPCALIDCKTQKNDRPGKNPTKVHISRVINGTGYALEGGVENGMYQASTDTWIQVLYFGERSRGSYL
jgi:hypothetical protein